MKKASALKLRRELPLATLTAILGMLAAAGLIVITYVQAAVDAAATPGALAVIIEYSILLAAIIAMPVLCELCSREP